MLRNFRRDVHLNRTALSVGLIDTLVAVMAGMIIFPAVFSVARYGAISWCGLGIHFIT